MTYKNCPHESSNHYSVLKFHRGFWGLTTKLKFQYKISQKLHQKKWQYPNQKNQKFLKSLLKKNFRIRKPKEPAHVITNREIFLMKRHQKAFHKLIFQSAEEWMRKKCFWFAFFSQYIMFSSLPFNDNEKKTIIKSTLILLASSCDHIKFTINIKYSEYVCYFSLLFRLRLILIILFWYYYIKTYRLLVKTTEKGNF